MRWISIFAVPFLFAVADVPGCEPSMPYFSLAVRHGKLIAQGVEPLDSTFVSYSDDGEFQTTFVKGVICEIKWTSYSSGYTFSIIQDENHASSTLQNGKNEIELGTGKDFVTLLRNHATIRRAFTNCILDKFEGQEKDDFVLADYEERRADFLPSSLSLDFKTKVASLIQQVDDDNWRVRDKATRGMIDMGIEVSFYLEKMDRSFLSTEQNSRIDRVIEYFK